MLEDSTSPLRILLDGDPRAPHQGRLGGALAARGHSVVVLGADDVVAMIRDEHGQRCEQIQRPARLLGPLQARALVNKALAAKIDVVHLNYVRPEQEAWLLPNAPPFVATAWGSDINEHDFPRAPAYNNRVDRVLRGAAAVTGDSVPMVAQLKRRARSERGRPTDLVMWGVDIAKFSRDRHWQRSRQLRAELGVSEDQLVLLSPRQNTPNYHTDRIVAAFAQSSWPSVGVLVIKLHGRAGQAERRQKLQDQAAALGVAERLRFAGKCAYEDLPAVYLMADAAVSALEADGVPSTFCELMALGVPILATNLMSYEGVLDEGRGLLVPVADSAAMADAMSALGQQSEKREAISRKARKHALGALSWSRSIDQWLALYALALGRQPTS